MLIPSGRERLPAFWLELGSKPAGMAGGAGRSIFARQQDRVVAEPERDLVEREVGVLDLFREDGAAVAVLTG